MAPAGVLAAIRTALNNQTLTIPQIAAGLTPLQKHRIWNAFINSILPITRTTVLGTITIANAELEIENGHVVCAIYGVGVLRDPQFSDGSWRWVVSPPPLFVPDPTSTDYTNANGATYRLDPIQAVYDILAATVRSQM